MGVGAYTSAILVTRLGFSFWLSLPCAGLVAALAGLIIGIPSLRVKGLYLCIATLAAQFIFEFIFTRWESMTKGITGIHIPPPTIGGYAIKTEKDFYWITLFFVVLAVVYARNLIRSRTGRAFIAIREKEFGIWQPVTWRGYYENVRDFALGLYTLGFKPGDKLAYAGDNRPEGLYSELAVQSLGGAIVGIYPDSHVDQVEYVLNHSDAVFVVAGDQEQADKVLDIKEKCPLVRKVIVDNPKGMRRYDDPILLFFKDVQKEGRTRFEKEPHLFEAMWRQVSPDDVGMINYTSGTTGLPKGSMITHKNMYSVAMAQDTVDPAEPSFEYMSFLIIDRMADGSKFSPQLIENKLRFSPYILDAVVIGQERPFIAAMIAIDMPNVGKWAENNQIPYTTFTDISQKEETYDLIAREVARTNESLPKVAKVKKFVLLYKELDADDDELTRTRKVRRKFVSERYKNLIDALYGDQERLNVEADIRYQDGKAFRMKTVVRVKEVEAGD